MTTTSGHIGPVPVEGQGALASSGSGTSPSPAEVAISVRGLTKTFTKRGGADVPMALAGIDLDVYRGEFLVLLGPSGCGKTTLLRSIAGLERPTSGTIQIGDEVVFDSRSKIDELRRPVSMIFQSYALWPHMTAYQHVAFPLQCAHTKRSEIPERVAHILELVDIAHLADRFPGQMSGGQQQRLAFARALVIGRDVVLMDEPLSNIDAQVREKLRLELLKMQRTIGFTAIYVTHDQSEAMELADRIAVMSRGQIAQVGSPIDVYDNPVDLDVARSLGQTNEIEFTVDTYDEGSGDVTGVGEGRRVTARFDTGSAHGKPMPGDGLVAFGRPRDFTITPQGERRSTAAPNQWEGRVEAVRVLSSHTEYVVKIGDVRLRCRLGTEPAEPREGDAVVVSTGVLRAVHKRA